MENVTHLASKAVRAWLRRQLISARKRRLSASEALAEIGEKLADLGMDKGFVPVEGPVVRPGLEGIDVVLQFCDFSEEKVTV